MTDPIDPNAAPRPRPGPLPADRPPAYQPPPPFAPPSDRPAASPWPLAREPGNRPRRSWAGGSAALEFLPPEEERKRRKVRIGAVALVLAALVAVGGYFLFFSGDSAPSPVALPPAFRGYQRLTDASARQAETQIRAGLSRFVQGHQEAIHTAGVGLYQQSSAGISRVVVLAFPTGAVDVSGPSYEVTDQMFGYLLPVNREYPAGAQGGSVRCGPIHIHRTRLVACAWSDTATTGLMYGASATHPADLAGTVNALRSAIH